MERNLFFILKIKIKFGSRKSFHAASYVKILERL